MSRSTTRRWAILLAVALGTAGCGSTATAAATVDGARIPMAAVDRDLADIARNPAYLAARSQQGLPFTGTKPGTYDAFTVAELLNRKVTAQLVHQELARRRVVAAPADLALARQALRRQVVDASGASVLEGFPKRYVEEQARIQAESDLLQAAEGAVAVDEAALRAAYDSSPDRYRVWCVRWILYPTGTDTDEAALASRDRAAVVGGEDFAAVAKRQSADPDSAGRGGALGCQTREGLARLGSAFRDAAAALAPGQVSAPTTADVGTFLVQATDVKVRPFDEVRGLVRAQVLEPAQEVYEQLLRRLRREAAVTVASRFGTWDRSDPDAIAIVPPGGRPTTTAAPATSLVP